MTQPMLVAIAIGAAASGVAAGLANTGFEDPINFDGNAVGNWTAFFGPAGDQFVNQDPAMPFSGANALRTSLSNAGSSFNGVVQRVDGIVVGDTYTLSLWAKAAGPVANGAEFRIEWLDAGGGFVGDQFANNVAIQDLLTDDYQQFAVEAVAPDGAVTANIVLAIQTFLDTGNGFDTNVFWDEVSFIPAPGGLAAVGLLGLGAARRRR